MAKFKKTAKKTTAGTRSAEDVQAQAEKLSKTLSESAQQIWLAGVGAFGRAQAEGTKLFEGLTAELRRQNAGAAPKPRVAKRAGKATSARTTQPAAKPASKRARKTAS